MNSKPSPRSKSPSNPRPLQLPRIRSRTRLAHVGIAKPTWHDLVPRGRSQVGPDTSQNAPYLCKKDGIVLHCPLVIKEGPSLWENPYSTTTSWKPCAERRDGGISDLPPENETNGYIFIHAEGGLNQQRIAAYS
ncbi:hypothetical protein SO802_014265 [Lithocarpus litseifolius]|uniref:Uncharacterized protein n=1 Tax=Lithocarpus litseifolius TaxID=425828 RepID=A0AAW2CRN3_9ROSI